MVCSFQHTLKTRIDQRFHLTVHSTIPDTEQRVEVPGLPFFLYGNNNMTICVGSAKILMRSSSTFQTAQLNEQTIQLSKIIVLFNNCLEQPGVPFSLFKPEYPQNKQNKTSVIFQVYQNTPGISTS